MDNPNAIADAQNLVNALNERKKYWESVKNVNEARTKEAEKLAELLQITFDTILENRYVDDEMRAVFNGNTVFILKGENGKLYGYYPKYNIARLTNVHYVKPDVTTMPNHYKRWFYPGERFHLYKPEELLSDIE
jgi:cupin superfamily acireductone dioxygenase involved in methionine salvage